MSLKFDLILAFSYLRVKGSERIIASFSLAGIILGVAILIITTAVMNGFRAQLVDGITGIDGHISIYSHIQNYSIIIKKLEEYKNIKDIVPSISHQVMLSSAENNLGVFMRAITKDNLKKSIISEKMLYGNLDNDGIIMGTRLAESLKVKIGDTINILSPQMVSTFMGSIPRMKSYKISGIFLVGIFEYDNMMAYMPIEQARTFFRYDGNSFNNIDIYLHDATKAHTLSQEISQKLDMPTISWQERGGYLEALETERSVMFLILTMIIVIASFNIISSLIMLVQNKRQSIAILRTIGATRSSIMRIFIICGSTIGLLGTLIGLILGLTFVHNIDTIRHILEHWSLFNPLIYFFSNISAVIITSDVIKITIMSLLLSFLATIIPAVKAARQDPAQILRGE